MGRWVAKFHTHESGWRTRSMSPLTRPPIWGVGLVEFCVHWKSLNLEPQIGGLQLTGKNDWVNYQSLWLETIFMVGNQVPIWGTRGWDKHWDPLLAKNPFVSSQRLMDCQILQSAHVCRFKRTRRKWPDSTCCSDAWWENTVKHVNVSLCQSFQHLLTDCAAQSSV